MPLISTGAALGGAAIGGALRLGSTLFGNYQRRKEQRRVEAREDTAVQRRVADLQAAGLSPTLAAGSAATTAAPPQQENPDLGGFSPEQMIALKQGMADVSRTEADTNLARVMAEEHSVATALKEQEYHHNVVQNPVMIEKMRSEIDHNNIHREQIQLENEITREHGKDAARLKNEAMRIANEIMSTHGMDEAEARVIGLRLANRIGEHNIDYAQAHDLPVGAQINPTSLSAGILRALGGRGENYQDLLDKAELFVKNWDRKRSGRSGRYY